jgi:hypothetical protein
LTTLHVLRVFVGPDNRGGNPLGVFLDGPAIIASRRQAVTAALGYSETVFVDDVARGAIRIFLPTTEAAFAGHPSVGTAWLLREVGAPADVLRLPAGDVAVRYDQDRTWIRARAAWVPGAVRMLELGSPEEVAAHPGQPIGEPWLVRLGLGGRACRTSPIALVPYRVRDPRGRGQRRGLRGHGRSARKGSDDPPGRRIRNRRPTSSRWHGRGRRPHAARGDARVPLIAERHVPGTRPRSRSAGRTYVFSSAGRKAYTRPCLCSRSSSSVVVRTSYEASSTSSSVGRYCRPGSPTRTSIPRARAR